jgi:glycogen operon protein
MGDEVRRTQGGNNNAYGQDNEISWFDWRLVEKHSGMLRFAKRLIAGHLQRDVSKNDPGLTLNQFLSLANISWHGVKLNQPDWGADSHVLALTLRSFRGKFLIHIMINAYWEDLAFEIPPVQEEFENDWLRWIDTALESPEDIRTWDDAVVIRERTYPVRSRSIVVLVGRLKNSGERHHNA